jgi:cytochrome c oxidase subunit 4
MLKPTPQAAGGHGAVQSGSEHVHHPTLGTYVVTYVILLVLLGVTVGLYYIDLQKVIPFVPGINLIVALIVAVIKAALVVMFFMNVKGGTKLTVLWAALGFIWLLFMGGIFMDYQSRQWIDQSGWQVTPISR